MSINSMNNSYAKAAGNAKKSYEDFKKSAAANFNNTKSSMNSAFEATKAENANKMQESATAMRKRFNEEYAEAMKGAEAQSPTETQPAESVPDTNHPPVNYSEEESSVQNETQNGNTLPDNAVSVQRTGVYGKYSITQGENGTGFKVLQNFKIGINNEARKFFGNATYIGLANENDRIVKDKDGYFTFRGLKSKNINMLKHKINLAQNKTAMNNAIYNDLLSKQKNGTTLSDAEQSFINAHLENLDKMHLAVDADGNLIEKS